MVRETEMKPKHIHAEIAAITTEHKSGRGDRQEQRAERLIEGLKLRVQAALARAERLEVPIQVIELPFPEDKDQWNYGVTRVNKRMAEVTLPASRAVYDLVNADREHPVDVDQTITIGTHDVQHGDSNGAYPTNAVASLDIITSFLVQEPDDNDLGRHPIDNLALLERLQPLYPVFPSESSRFKTGGDSKQFDIDIRVTRGMEFEAHQRWNNWESAIEGMNCALDQFEEALDIIERGHSE